MECITITGSDRAVREGALEEVPFRLNCEQSKQSWPEFRDQPGQSRLRQSEETRRRAESGSGAAPEQGAA